MTLHNDVHDSLVLLDSDRESLAGSRGFTDSIVEKYGLKSGCPDNARALFPLIKSSNVLELENFGYVVRDSLGRAFANPQLLEHNIIIPYYDKDKAICRLRPHKKGFKGLGHSVFRTHSSFKKNSICVIAESEFKAIASEAMGVSAIGIPGISSMSGKNWDMFLEVLQSINTKMFCICFDNEIKDDPSFPNYKSNWRKRYDTDIYAYAMCTKIIEAGLSCTIARLPNKWRAFGKADIDGVLAQCVDHNEYRLLIESAGGPKKFYEECNFPEEHLPYITRRVRSFFIKSNICIKNNCFYVKRSVEDADGTGKDKDIKLCNCHIVIRATYSDASYNEEGLRRDIQIIDEYGIASKRIPLVASCMSNKGALQTWLISQGNYLFYGNDKDVIPMWEYIFAHDEGEIIWSPPCLGYIEEHRLWLFKNCLIKEGSLIEADKDGICWHDNTGFKPYKLSEQTVLPTIIQDKKFDLKKFTEHLSDTADDRFHGMARILIGWTIGNCFLKDIFEKFKMYPILFMYGGRSSGKTTIMRWLLSFFGLQDNSVSLSSSTVVGLSRSMGYYSNLPLVVDDWRDDTAFDKYIPFFLGVYNRQTGVKGIRKSHGTQDFDIRSSLAILGEEMIHDNGVSTRCISYYLSGNRDKDHYWEINNYIDDASSVVCKILKNYDTYRTLVIKKIDKMVADLSGIQVEKRVLFNYVIPAAVYCVISEEKDNIMEEYIRKVLQEKQTEVTSGDKVHKFSEDFLACRNEFILKPHHYEFSVDGREIDLYLKGICDVMSKYYNARRHDPMLLLKHFLTKKYFVKCKQRRLGGSEYVPVITLNIKQMPNTMRVYYALQEQERDGSIPDETGHAISA